MAVWTGAPDTPPAPSSAPTGWARLLAARASLSPSPTPQAAPTHPSNRPSTWHFASVASLAAVVGHRSPLHSRALERLLPGPVTLAIDAPPERILRARRAAGLQPQPDPTSPIDAGDRFSARVAAHPLLPTIAAALADAPGALLAEGIPSGAPGSPLLLTIADARRRLADAGIEVAFAFEPGPSQSPPLPAPLGRPSAIVALTRDGGASLLRQGPTLDSDDQLRAALHRRLLFVCTGNTCRSPMAQLIAQALLARRAGLSGPGAVPTAVESAGIAAQREPWSPQTLEALRITALAPQPTGPAAAGRSQPVSADMLRDADAVWVMTRAQLDAVRRLAPDAAPRAELLDPLGQDIPDPFGGPVSLYTQLARRIAPIIERRLDELDRGRLPPHHHPPPGALP